jgi:hypothetical protein
MKEGMGDEKTSMAVNVPAAGICTRKQVWAPNVPFWPLLGFSAVFSHITTKHVICHNLLINSSTVDLVPHCDTYMMHFLDRQKTN